MRYEYIYPSGALTKYEYETVLNPHEFEFQNNTKTVGCAFKRDGEYLTVDIDDMGHESCGELFANLPTTMLIRTSKGVHYVYKVPSNIHRDYKNTKIGKAYELLVNGYERLPGTTLPGKCYSWGTQIEPVEAPQWLLDKLERRQQKTQSETPLVAHYVDDYHADYLFERASAFRGNFGMTEDSIVSSLRDLLPSLRGGDPDDPFTDEHLRAIAKSVCKYPPEIKGSWKKQDEQKDEAEYIVQGCAFEVPTFSWYIHGFIPKGGYLVTGYAPGGTGKSSFGHYLASLVTRSGGNFLVINHEDSPEYWKSCAVVSGADPKHLFSHSRPLLIKSPTNVDYLEETILKHDLKCIWFDSIKDHFASDKGSDAAVISRSALSPLADLAQRTGCLIIGIFHTNKKGLPGGSTEMLNVARHVLEFSRAENGPLIIKVDKTNLHRPNYVLKMLGENRQLIHPNDRTKVLYQESEDGEMSIRESYITHGYDKDSGLLRIMEENKEKEALKEKITEMLDMGMKQTDIAKTLGISQSKVSRLIQPSRSLSSL